MENLKNNNYDLLLRLGFDRDFIDENKRLGLKERKQDERKIKHQYMLEYASQRRTGESQVFEKPEEKKDYIVTTEDHDEYRFVQITPPPKEAIDKKDLVAISSMPVWAHNAFA